MKDTEKQPAPRRAPPGKDDPASASAPRPREHGGPEGPEPTRYGDWERNGRCFDF